MAHEAGVKFVVGTDTGFAMTPYGEWHAKELELLMKYGGALRARGDRGAATYNGAHHARTSRARSACVAPGMLADLLVVDGDPSEDITVLQDRERIETIILDGEVVEIDRDLESWPNEPSYVYSNTYLTQEVARGALGGAHRGGIRPTPCPRASPAP